MSRPSGNCSFLSKEERRKGFRCDVTTLCIIVVNSCRKCVKPVIATRKGGLSVVMRCRSRKC